LPVALPRRPFLYAIVDVAFLGGRGVGPAVAALARGGAGLLQLRAKGVADRLFLSLAREAVEASRAAGVPLLVNDRPDIARLVGADGVHVGQDDLCPADVRRILPAPALVGISVHNTAQLEAAARAPVDYVAVGPVFPTTSKARPDPVVGLDFVRQARTRTALPLVVIGGIRRENALPTFEAGADGIALISALLSRADLAEAAHEICRALTGAP
jgi:thiamine-phosphate pyrophosphorylase